MSGPRTLAGALASRWRLLPLAAVALVAFAAALAEPGGAGPAAGEAIYRSGVLPSGDALTAVVSGDVPLSGTSAACATCHGRSGMGSVEGRQWVPPITAPVLAAPRGSGVRLRPSYDDASLVRALRDGLDAAGRPLDSLMPRYALAPADLAALTAYLRVLGSGPAPGVTASEIRFATVVTPDAEPERVRSMLAVLEGFIRTKQTQVRSFARYGVEHDTFRRWTLATWRLEGPAASWAGQLEAYQAASPVFALLAGAGGTEWGPVDAFCEAHRIPCLLPVVDVVPPAAGSSAYTVYLSRGVALEAAAIAGEIAGVHGPVRVVQLVPASGAGRAGAAALRAALASRADVDVRDATVGGRDEPASGAVLASLRHDGPYGRARVSQAAAAPARRVAVFWVAPALVGPALDRTGGEPPWDRAFLSSTVVDGEPSAWTGLPLPRTEVVHPFTRPDELAPRLANLELSLRSRGIPPGIRRVQDQALLACVMAGEALMHQRREFGQEYLLELVDHLGSSATVSAFHSRLSSGPGQRVLERGAWLVAADGPLAAARWVSP